MSGGRVPDRSLSMHADGGISTVHDGCRGAVCRAEIFPELEDHRQTIASGKSGEEILERVGNPGDFRELRHKVRLDCQTQ